MRPLITFLLWACCLLSAHAQFSLQHKVEASEFEFQGRACVSDLDGDGDNDLVACGFNSGIGWYRNDGAGGFSELLWVDSLGFEMKIAVADLESDGDNDIVVGGSTATVLVYLNDGLASFSGPISALEQETTSYVLETADLNGDALLDLVFCNLSENAVQWSPGIGGGQFGTVQQVMSGLALARNVTVADLNSDGAEDVVCATYGGQVQWSANDGGGGFGALLNVGTTLGGGVHDVHTADLDGDGDADVLCAASDSTTWWWANDGAGVFGSPQAITSALSASRELATADIDGDGDLDVLIAQGYKRMWCENMGGGQFTDHLISKAEMGACTLADLNADGDPDLVELESNITWSPNDGSGVFSPRHVVCATLDQLVVSCIGDLDNDGDNDVLSNLAGFNKRMVFYLNEGAGTFGRQQVLSDTIGDVADARIGDMDGDGDMDIVVMGYTTTVVFVNDGQAHFQVAQEVPSVAEPRVLVLEDLDEDGDLDMASASLTDDLIIWRANAGNGQFGAQQVISSTIDAPEGVVGVDVDNDGDIDLVSSSQGNHDHVWYANNGNGTFAAAVVMWNDPDYYWDMRDVSYGDVNGDDLPDLLHLGALRMNTGGGTFGPATSIENSPPYQITSAGLSDLDQDGDLDLLYTPADMLDAVFCRMNDGAGNFGEIMVVDLIHMLGWGTEITARDMDMDGDPDIVAGLTGGTRANVVWYESFVNTPYHIQGTVFLDEDENGIQDGGEGGLPLVFATATPAAAMPMTDSTGAYDIFADEEDYVVNVNLPNAWWGLTTDSASYHVSLTGLQPVSMGNDFGYAPVVDTTLLYVGILANTAPCSGNTVQYIGAFNLGTTQPSGTICYTLDSLFTFGGSLPLPTSINGNTYCWSYDSLGYYDLEYIVINVLNPSADEINNEVQCTLTVTEEDEQQNVLHTFNSVFQQVITCAFDPNDKQVSPVGYGWAGAVPLTTEYLDFRIRFQNTGNATATDVMISDQLSTYLDRNSLQVTGYSHPLSRVVIGPNGDLTVRFDNIQLPDSGADFAGSQGFLSYRIHLLPGLMHGTQIFNTANIFFDLNAPVITNTTSTMLVDCSLWSPGAITSPEWNMLQAPFGETYQWYLNGTAIPGATDLYLVLTTNGEYTVDVTSEYGCISTSEPFQVITAEVNDLPKVTAAAIPNPFTDHTTLLFSEALQLSDQFQLIDLNGRVLRTLTGMSGNKVTIEQGDLPAGLYMIRVLRNDQPWCTARVVAE